MFIHQSTWHLLLLATVGGKSILKHIMIYCFILHIICHVVILCTLYHDMQKTWCFLFY